MAFNRGTLFVTSLTLLLAWLGTAHAGNHFMSSGSRTTQPIGHYEFCQKIPAECRQKTPKKAPIELTQKLWATISTINHDVNTSVIPATDMEIWGREEVWSYPIKGMGDCEDYVLEKRRRLMKAGIPAGNLLITVVRQPNGEGHAVLTVHTSAGDFILDNLEDEVLIWSKTRHTYLKRQSTQHSGVWISIDDGRADAVASVR
ncbi:transglutaminase-like cysteine peptidase [Aquamicrobium segne]|uniref:Transglutaminase-like cysteine peptidase n=1 Tax=Aquamicrobium segne TaxID=469547 RepID=A0ABW0GXI5_9HYPH